MKRHGWGWVPISWEGWAVTAGFIAYTIFISTGMDKSVSPTSEWWMQLGIGIIVFIMIAYQTGPSPRWRWDK